MRLSSLLPNRDDDFTLACPSSISAEASTMVSFQCSGVSAHTGTAANDAL